MFQSIGLEYPSHGTLNGIKHFYSCLPKSTPSFPMHFHKHIELFLLTKGSLEVDFGTVQFIANAGEVVIIPPNQPHAGRYIPPITEYHVIQFDIDDFQNNIIEVQQSLNIFMNKDNIFSHTTNDNRVIKAVKRLFDLNRNSLLISADIYNLLLLLSEKCINLSVKENSDKRFEKIFEYIHTNFSDELTTNSVSEIFSYNESYFCRRFKTITGMNFTKYLQTLRLNNACKLLCETKKDINEIYSICGFNNFSYFTHCFKKAFGTTPSEYRNTNRTSIYNKNDKHT